MSVVTADPAKALHTQPGCPKVRYTGIEGVSKES